MKDAVHFLKISLNLVLSRRSVKAIRRNEAKILYTKAAERRADKNTRIIEKVREPKKFDVYKEHH